MPTLSLGGNSYFSYATTSDADTYLLPDLNYATWNALTSDQKTGLLIQSTRFIDSLEYIESADTQAERELIDAFTQATILIASLVSTGQTAILGVSVPEAQQKILQAGSVMIENFRSTFFYFPSAYANWPQNIYLLLKPYLKSLSNTSLGATSFGTCGTNPIEDYSILND